MNEYKEARKIFERIIDNEAYKESFQNACKLAIELIEKAIPKKTKAIEDWYTCYYDCPNCGISIWCEGYEKDHKYCFNCGQAIDCEIEVQENE